MSELAKCIFCEEMIDATSEECPHCSKKPFSGMYFDSNTYTLVKELEERGELEEAWKLLNDEWIQHGDYDYYDDEMYFELYGKMHELYERNPTLIRQRIELIKNHWRDIVFYSYVVGQRDAEEGLDVARKAGRKDLEDELIEYLDEIH